MAVTDTINTYLESAKNFWQDFDLRQWSENMAGTYAQALQAGMYFAGSFAVGFLFKRYFKLLFTSLVVLVLVLKFMEYNAMATINWDNTKNFFGLHPTTDIHAMINTGLTWVKNNILLFVSSCVGFLIGYKLG